MLKKRRALLALLIFACLLTGCGNRDPFKGIPDPEATIELSNGASLHFELYLHEAPNTVANFVELAQSGFYDGLEFFRIVPGVLVQSGDPRNNGTGHAEYAIQGEFAENGIENGISHVRGVISMCRQEADPDSASSQFFIMLGSYPEYNGKYAAFGMAQDTATLDALDALAYVNVDGNYAPVGPVPHIVTIEIDTHGYEYEAAKLEFPSTTRVPETETESEE